RTGSGSHGPTYSSRRARAEVNMSRQIRVVVVMRNALGSDTVSRSVPCQRKYVSCTASSASAIDQSMRYARPSRRRRYGSKLAAGFDIVSPTVRRDRTFQCDMKKEASALFSLLLFRANGQASRLFRQAQTWSYYGVAADFFNTILTSSGLIKSGTVQPSRSYSAIHCSAKPLYFALCSSLLATISVSNRLFSWFPNYSTSYTSFLHLTRTPPASP